MFNFNRRRCFACTGCIAVVFGFLLTGCHKDEPKPSAPGYYSGPMEGKGKAKAATDDTTK